MAKRKLTAEEKLRRRKKAKADEERLRLKHYRAIPQKLWREWSGRQAKILKDQQATYGIPFGGRTINLEDVVRKLHDFLAANAAKLRTLENRTHDEDTQEWRRWRAREKRLDVEEKEGKLVDAEKLRPLLESLTAILREPLAQLQREYGLEAYRLVEDAVDRFDQDVARHFEEGL